MQAKDMELEQLKKLVKLVKLEKYNELKELKKLIELKEIEKDKKIKQNLEEACFKYLKEVKYIGVPTKNTLCLVDKLYEDDSLLLHFKFIEPCSSDEESDEELE